jgi:hypothetical protein
VGPAAAGQRHRQAGRTGDADGGAALDPFGEHRRHGRADLETPRSGQGQGRRPPGGVGEIDRPSRPTGSLRRSRAATTVGPDDGESADCPIRRRIVTRRFGLRQPLARGEIAGGHGIVVGEPHRPHRRDATATPRGGTLLHDPSIEHEFDDGKPV